MKKILLVLLINSFFSHGQNSFSLGDYITLNKNNIEFKYKKPLSPFYKVDESYSRQGNSNLVTSYLASMTKNVLMLQIYASPVPKQFMDFNWETLIKSKQQSKIFLNSFLNSANNKGMKITNFRNRTIASKSFLEVESTLTVSGITQRQINWITVYKNNFINILGATLSSYDKNVFFFKEFSRSVILD